MSHKSEEELRQNLSEAHTRVRIGGRYRHYKGQEYTVVGFAVIEVTSETGVLYRAEYKELQDIVFLRPLEEFLSLVSTDKGKVARFALVP